MLVGDQISREAIFMHHPLLSQSLRRRFEYSIFSVPSLRKLFHLYILFPFFYFAIFCSAERTAIKYDDPHHYDPTTRVAGLFQGCLTRIAHSRWLGVDLLSSRLVGLLKYSLLYRVYLSLEAGQNPQTSNRNFTSWSISFSSSRSSISWMFRSPAPFLPWFLLFNPPSQSSL